MNVYSLSLSATSSDGGLVQRNKEKKKKRDFWRRWGAKKHGEKSLLKSWDGQTKGTSHSQNE